MNYNEIEEAFNFMSHGYYGDHMAMVCRSTGTVCWCTADGENDDIPEEAYESDDWITVPDFKDLRCGQNLVFDFVDERIPADIAQIHSMFRKSGAYARYKDLLGACPSNHTHA